MAFFLGPRGKEGDCVFRRELLRRRPKENLESSGVRPGLRETRGVFPGKKEAQNLNLNESQGIVKVEPGTQKGTRKPEIIPDKSQCRGTVQKVKQTNEISKSYLTRPGRNHLYSAGESPRQAQRRK